MAKVEINLTNIEKLTKQLEKANRIGIKVGVNDSMQYKNGKKPIKVGKVAEYLEYGWTQTVKPKQSKWFKAQGIYNIKAGTTLNNPPRPFFGATARAKKAEWQRLGVQLLHGLPASDNQLNKIMQAFEFLGMKAVQDIQDTILNGGVEGVEFALRSPLTMLMYGKLSAGHKTDGTGTLSSDKPLNKSGLLLNSIAFEITTKIK